jgi:hypothetical protein
MSDSRLVRRLRAKSWSFDRHGIAIGGELMGRLPGLSNSFKKKNSTLMTRFKDPRHPRADLS